MQLPFGSFVGMGSSDVTAQSIALTSTYGFAIVGITSLTTGNQKGPDRIDSWNSAAGPYTTFSMNSNGNCSSNGNITLVSGTVIDGRCQPGIGKTVFKTGSTVTGTTVPLNYTLNFPAPIPGPAATTNNNASLPSAYFNSSTRDFVIPKNAAAFSLPGGTYYVNSIDWEGETITFTGPAVFYITGTGVGMKNSAYGFWTWNNHITTYQNKPANLKFEVVNATNVQYDFDIPIYAVLYCPLSTVKTWGNADDYGSVVGNVLNMYVGWHVDESLGGAGVLGTTNMVQ